MEIAANSHHSRLNIAEGEKLWPRITATMGRVAAMLLLLGAIVVVLLVTLALFSVAPMFCCCFAALLYILACFIINEAGGMHHAQEFENRFWTVFAVLMATAIIFVRDSPLCFGDTRPGLGISIVFISGFFVHMYDRMKHRNELSTHVTGLRRGASAAQSLVKLSTMGVSVEEQLERIRLAMSNIDQLLLPSTINNYVNTKFILTNERAIISVFEDAQPKMLNYLVCNSKLALILYKVKDHRNYRGQHRTQLIELLAVDRLSVLTIYSRVLLLRALQRMKLTSNLRAEHWVRNIILRTHRDDLSSLKTLADSNGDVFCMNKLIYDDIRSDTVRQDILIHIKKEASVQQAHMDMGTRWSRSRLQKGWRKILSDVDDTLTSSGGSYPAGMDKRFNKGVVYPGVLGLYRELDLGICGPDESPSNTGNLVFLSARPHVYKDISEKHNFSKFRKLCERQGVDGRGGLHTTPSLLAGDLASGREFMMTNDFEPLARKKFDNFKRFVSIYPEYKHVFVCDNGQGDVRAGELMHDQFPQHLEVLFVHLVQDIEKTHGFDSERWRRKGLLSKTCFFKMYPDAALYAAIKKPPLIRTRGLLRVCEDAVTDFEMILQWSSESQKRDRRQELNQSLWRCNKMLNHFKEETVPLIENPQLWQEGEKVQTPYGKGVIKAFDPVWDLYEIELNWRPLDQQVKEHEEQKNGTKEAADGPLRSPSPTADRNQTLQTVVEEDDECNYLSPATSFQASKISSKQSFTELDQAGKFTSAPIDEEQRGPTTHKQVSGLGEKFFAFDADAFDQEVSVSSDPTLDESAGTSILEIDIAKSLESPSITAKERINTKKISPCQGKYSAKIQGKYSAKIQGKYITKYTPPSIPKLPKDDKNRSKFSFWTTESLKSTVDIPLKVKFVPGEKVSCPYGVGSVIRHRQKTRIVVVDISGPWSAQAYLQENIVKREGAGFLGTILRQFSSAQTLPKSKSSDKKGTNVRQFPYVAGTPIYSPFGEGMVIRPLPLSKDREPIYMTPNQAPRVTMAVSLTSWTLQDGSHPELFCTAHSAEKWRNKALAVKESSLFSVIGSLVSGTVKSLKNIRVPREIEAPIKIETPKFERYYKDGAAVNSVYGDGTVCSFREADGFYVVQLRMKCGKAFGVAYLSEDSMSYRIARGCVENYPVMTTFGSGVLQSVNPTTGVHRVFIQSFGAVCYLQPNQVLRPLKAAVGEDVSTPYGEGKVWRYRLSDSKYEIKLAWGDSVMLYATAETFDRIDDRLEDKGGFGMGWILKFFHSREEDKEGGTQRSRSNSFSVLSQSGLSIKSLR